MTYRKYLKYKLKYLELKQQLGAAISNVGNIDAYRSKIDGDNGHIQAGIQNLILAYNNCNYDDFDSTTTTNCMILSSYISDITSNTRASTQSNVWVPFIWSALQKSGRISNIPQQWYASNDNNDELNKLAQRIITIPGWIEYTLYILSDKYNSSSLSLPNEFNDVIFNESNTISKHINENNS